MAPLRISIRGVDVVVTAQPLEASAFAPFGEVIQNPRPGLHPSNFAAAGPLPLAAVSANQGSAIKYQHVTRMVNMYDQAPSRRPGVAVMNMFVCAARKLGTRQGTSHSTTPSSRVFEVFEVGILERHPYTTQTFTPLSTSGPASPPGEHGYLVIVAPGLQTPSGSSAGRTPSHALATAPTDPDRGIHYNSQAQSQPDLQRLKAFVATTDQAVTYGAGVWHAPMVALGPEGSTVDYVVTQFANGVGIEDCEEVVMESPGNNGHILVELPLSPSSKVSRL
ncbi:putative ureidoglycolate hydrolase [Diaporthe ampelina]|uniref:Putative ureidoglycolate hydrolase n=1 Tax=Diaporthe ampelina TaxID=1214573 RepID=A0A0G2IG99_9PEZI|nr:putative ureidoglycolate hydrolase [Diaporthe ampelina]